MHGHAESLVHALKTEFLHEPVFDADAQLKAAMHSYIAFCNQSLAAI